LRITRWPFHITTPRSAAKIKHHVHGRNFAVHWREEEYYQPPARFIAQANAADPAVLERFSEEHCMS
jgi:acetyl-CoA synthetase